jgi:hypothetical protein
MESAAVLEIEELPKITATSAQEICVLAAAGGFQLPPAGGRSSAQFLSELMAAGSFNEAVQFISFALPRREAVWWACRCARSELREPVLPVVMCAVLAAEAWVRQPTEQHRREAMACAQATDFKSPAAWAAVAAFWSGGSLGPANLSEIPAPPHLIGAAVAGAVTLAAVQTEPELADQKRERYLSAAIDIAKGGTGRIKPIEG